MIKVTEDDLEDGNNGICLSCGELVYGGIEPDACGYDCESCGHAAVSGLQEALIAGAIEVN